MNHILEKNVENSVNLQKGVEKRFILCDNISEYLVKVNVGGIK